MGNYQIGDDAFASFGRFGRLDVRKGKVVNVSHNGTVRVDFDGKQISYNRNRFERGSDYNGSHLIDAEAFASLEKRMIVQRAEKRALDRIADAANIRLDAANRAVILTKLEAAIEAVNEIPYEGE